MRSTGAGRALEPAARASLESATGTNLGGVRVHTDADAATSASKLGALAYTVGADVVFGEGQYRPESSEGMRLLAHEVAHTLQQSAGGGPVLQRQQDPRAAETGAGAQVDPQRNSGPCAIDAAGLSNQELLFQLNRARAYLTQNERGEGEYYDYGNLLRRLSAERRRRVNAGHVWLAEPGLLHVPDVLYSLEASGPLEVAVTRISGEQVAGTATVVGRTLVTPAQFDRFMAGRNVPQVDAATYFATRDPSRSGPLRIPLPAQPRTMMMSTPLAPSLGLRLPITLNASPFARPGLFPGLQPPVSHTYIPSADIILRELNSAPGGVVSTGPERVYLPAQRSLAPDGNSANPIPGMSALGFLGQPGAPLPTGTTGVLWQGSHASDLAVINGRFVISGFRAGMSTHGFSGLERALTRGGGPVTAMLNRGTPGTYANDALFPYFPDAVAVVRTDGSLVEAEELVKLMQKAGREMRGEIYRYSTPPREHPAFRRAFGNLPATVCPPGASNCINLPMAVHDVALGGHHMVLPGQNGPIDLSLPQNATAANMDVYVNPSQLPEEFFLANNLRRVRVAPAMWRGVGMGGALGAGMALAGNAVQDVQGGQTHYVRDITFGFGSSATGVLAENYATNYATQRLVTAGMSPTASSTLGRVAGGTGAAVVLAPLVTTGGMLLDEENYTDIDYAARAGRSTVAAGGSALATGLLFAAMGSEVPIAGNIVGFLVGIGVYYVTDSLIGDDTEEAIRLGLGEGGCTGGVGPGH
ncbi:DUF4157 domain-containing protein [Archangium violaceum]|uniref:eCIS core domain-containing protein n=1 Tax=Archangium violaceum TaxID=83451 RepID=UPI00195097A0|nr:DUF4157 domain-containing protein [Archangium violaceum]QRN93091.1 DUF4157 domain-containing protein [Archangium violaceum]